jgi:hypothetical protein
LSELTGPQLALARCSRAIGAIFFALFADAWLALWNYRGAPTRLVLAKVGLGSWVIPTVILLALIYPFMAAGGPAEPVGCLGAGLILWLSALLALTRH